MEEEKFRATKGIRIRYSVWTVSRDRVELITFCLLNGLFYFGWIPSLFESVIPEQL